MRCECSRWKVDGKKKFKELFADTKRDRERERVQKLATMKRNKQIDMKRALAVAGTFNFLCCCARACLLPFLTLYFRQLGLTPAMTGIVMGTKHLISLVWSPAASQLSKRYDKRRAVINGSLVCSAAVAVVLLLVSPADVHPQTASCNASDLRPGANLLGSSAVTAPVSTSGVTLPATTLTDAKSAPVPTTQTALNRYYDDDTSHPLLSLKKTSAVANDGAGEPSVAPVGSSVAAVRKKRSSFRFFSGSEDKLGEETTQEEDKGSRLGFLVLDPQHQLFFLTLVIVLVWELASAPLEWTADDGLYEYLDFAYASDRYGSTRVWGLLGAACGVGGAGVLVSQLRCLVAYRTPGSGVHFLCYAALAALALPAAACLPLYLNKKRNRANGLLKAALLVRGSPRAALCAVTALLVGCAASAVDNFLLWQMQDQGSGELHMGLSLALAALSEAAFPLLAGRVSKLLSPERVLVVAAASLGLQCFYYSFLWAPWAALPAQVLSCFSGGALWWAVKAQCAEVATPGAERSVSKLYSALSLHLGSGLGSFAGGFVVQRFGLTWLFRGAAVCVMAWCVCLPLLQWKAPRQRRINYCRLLAAGASEASDSESEQERDWLEKAMEDSRSNNNYGRGRGH
ncbi:major facilitator superfamily domain-containing protein 6-like [Perca flavescens]|uniref:major facilitator superfamily domain-containing protein 6-like n=1 Tax=Perca flavescens TaxID=8167 RepID=UPI00106DDA48|nr:major facilitator superfamily domain-containing protein 6-like [Perca flavescens]